jgi:D-lyxose ketol-isomerase
MNKTEMLEAQEKAYEVLKRAGILLTEKEQQNVEIADFGLNELNKQGLQIITYINTDRYCAKDLILFGRQTCPEHRHPPVDNNPGKMETFRCRAGKVWLYIEGDSAASISAKVPEGSEKYYTVFNEIELNPGEQYTIQPNTLHWFQAGDEGVVISEFSSTSRDELDVFTDPRIKRVPVLESEL